MRGARRTCRPLAALLAATALVSIAPFGAWAETVRVGAGEHGGHSRVVLNMAPPQGWIARKTADGVEITLPGIADPFAAEAVTTRKRAHRVEGFSTRREGGATVVTLDFNCLCDARVYPLNGKALVIDVTDIATAQTPDASPAAKPTPPGEAAAPGDDDVARAQAMLLEQLKKAEEQGLITFKDGSPVAKEQAADALEEKTDTPALETSDAPKEMAAAPGAPSVQPGDAPAPDGTDKTEPSTPGAPPHRAENASSQGEMGDKAEMAGGVDVGEPMAAESTPPKMDHSPSAKSIELAVEEAGAAAPAMPAFALPACLPDAELDIAAWRVNGPFFEILAAKRSAVFDELSRIDPDGVLALARHYLSAGLGLEAAAIPESFDLDTPELRAVAAMGRVLEGRTPLYADIFARPEPCPGKHGLWQAAALAEIDPVAAAEAFAGTGRALARTPEPLRRTLGARIGQALAVAGDYEGARQILKLLSRSLDAPTEHMLMLEAEIALEEGRDVAARAALRQVAEGRSPLKVVALVRLSELMQAPQDKLLVPALALRLSDEGAAWRGESYGVTITAAEAKLRARFGDLVGAVDAIDRHQSRLDPQSERLAALRGALLETEIAAVAESGDSKRMAAAVEVARKTPKSAEGVRLRLDLADVLVDAGAAHLTPLLIDAELRAASKRAEGVALRAEAAAELSGAPIQYADPTAGMAKGAEHKDDKGGDQGEDYGTAGAQPIETADAVPAEDPEKVFAKLRRRAFDAYLAAPHTKEQVIKELEASDHPEAPSLITLLTSDVTTPAVEPGATVSTPTAIGGGRELLRDLDAEMELMKEIADDG